MDYESFVASKLALPPPTGIKVEEASLPASLFPFQRALSRWSLGCGRSAIFAGTGLGKTAMQLAWADRVCRETGGDALVLAPLAVARQTAREGARLGVSVTVCRDGADVRPGVNVSNYERLHRLDPSRFKAVVLDESSCIKHFASATLRDLLAAFRDTPWKLCCTATPAPNDWVELGTHAEFLGVCKRTEMLSEFFVHDSGDTSKWRLKGHAQGAFWRWVASWAALVAHPRDLGDETPGYDLPPLGIEEHLLAAAPETARKAGLLFVEEAVGLMAQRQARKATVDERVAACAKTVNDEPSERWVVWANLNAESEALAEMIKGSVEITGSMDADEKEARMDRFLAGEHRVLVSKSSIAGFGCNLQFCARQAFVGVDNSWEGFYQAVRRSWRFGQTRAVKVHVFASELEGAVVANLRRKEEDAEAMAEALSRETAAVVREQVMGPARTTAPYEPKARMEVPEWLR